MVIYDFFILPYLNIFQELRGSSRQPQSRHFFELYQGYQLTIQPA